MRWVRLPEIQQGSTNVIEVFITSVSCVYYYYHFLSMVRNAIVRQLIRDDTEQITFMTTDSLEKLTLLHAISHVLITGRSTVC